MADYLHIISFDVPYPANYGGVIDVYFKIKSLHEAGVRVILHCFLYNDKQEAAELEKICYEVHYYQRNTSMKAHLSLLPYTVYSRKNDALLVRLQADGYPILFEGLMSCYYLSHPSLRHRVKLLRECNIEHNYYYQLFKTAKGTAKRLFYFIESLKLRFFERKLRWAAIVYAISASEQAQLQQRYPGQNITFMPCYHSNDKLRIKPGQSDYLLYHGNLSVAENELAAIYLSEEVFAHLPYRCIIAGMKPGILLQNQVAKFGNIQLIANPDENEMARLIQNAQINVLITQQTTGLKIKLLNALFSGRHVIANEGILEGSGLDNLCHIANTAEEQIRLCNQLMNLPFDEKQITEREQQLHPLYSNQFQAEFIASAIRIHHIE